MQVLDLEQKVTNMKLDSPRYDNLDSQRYGNLDKIPEKEVINKLFGDHIICDTHMWFTNLNLEKCPLRLLMVLKLHFYIIDIQSHFLYMDQNNIKYEFDSKKYLELSNDLTEIIQECLDDIESTTIILNHYDNKIMEVYNAINSFNDS